MTIRMVDLRPFQTFVNGQKTVTTAGTAVSLIGDSTQKTKSITIKALSGNTGLIYVGTSSVSSSNGFELNAKESVSFDVDNSKTEIWIDAATNGEGVSYIYVV